MRKHLIKFRFLKAQSPAMLSPSKQLITGEDTRIIALNELKYLFPSFVVFGADLI